MLINQIIQLLYEALNNLDYPQKEIKVSPSKNPEFGDLSSSIPLMLVKDLNQGKMIILTLKHYGMKQRKLK